MDQQAMNCVTGVVQSSGKRRMLIEVLLELPEDQLDRITDLLSR